MIIQVSNLKKAVKDNRIILIEIIKERIIIGLIMINRIYMIVTSKIMEIIS